MEDLVINLNPYVVCIRINLDIIAATEQFDPFPFGLLTMIVSLEAIVLAIVVLSSQNRAAHVADLREETDLQLVIITERELTKVLELVTLLAQKGGIQVAQD